MTDDSLGGSRRSHLLDFETDPVVLVEELRRRNLVAVAMDLLYLFTVAFFAHHLLQGFWPAVIGGIPLAFLLYFGWRSSKAFFVTELVVIGLTLVVSNAGFIPL